MRKIICFLVLLLILAIPNSLAEEYDEFDDEFPDPQQQEFDPANMNRDELNSALQNPQFTPEQSQALYDAIKGKPQILEQIEPHNVNNLGQDIVNDFGSDLNSQQVKAIEPSLQTQLEPQTIQELLDDMEPDQMKVITEDQAQEFTTEDLETVFENLEGDDLEDFLEKISQEQFVEYVTQNPNVEDLAPEIIEKFGETINELLSLKIAYGTIDGTVVENNGVSLDLNTFAQGSWELSTTENGFEILAGSFNELSFSNPLNNDTIETELQAGQGLTVELLDDNAFVLKLNDEFINLDIIPEGPSRVRFYSKVEDSTIKIYTNGDYEFSEGILTFDNAAYHEEIDTLTDAIATIDHAVGFVCMLMNKEDIYKFEDRVTLNTWSVKMSLDQYKFCIKKSDYIKDLYFDSVLQFEEMAGNRQVGYVNLLSSYMWFGSWIEYYVNDVLSYQSRGRFGSEIDQGKMTVTTKTPEKMYVFDNYVIYEDVNVRYLRVSPTKLSDFSLNHITNDDDPELFIDSNKLVQTSSINNVIAYRPGSREENAFVEGLTNDQRNT